MNLGLIIKGSKVVVSSRMVAEVYEKRHDVVLRDIRNLIKTIPEALHNFEESYYINENNRDMPEYIMDRQGFSMLVMGFTGEKAKRFTYQYTKAFEEMAQQINQPKQLSPMEILKVQMQVLDNHDNRLSNLENHMTIDYGQQRDLQVLAQHVALEFIGGKSSLCYKDNGLRTKVFSSVWKDYKDYFQVSSYRNTPRVEFEKAKDYLNNWQPQGKLLREIEDANRSVRAAM